MKNFGEAYDSKDSLWLHKCLWDITADLEQMNREAKEKLQRVNYTYGYDENPHTRSIEADLHSMPKQRPPRYDLRKYKVKEEPIKFKKKDKDEEETKDNKNPKRKRLTQPNTQMLKNQKDYPEYLEKKKLNKDKKATTLVTEIPTITTMEQFFEYIVKILKGYIEPLAEDIKKFSTDQEVSALMTLIDNFTDIILKIQVILSRIRKRFLF